MPNPWSEEEEEEEEDFKQNSRPIYCLVRSDRRLAHVPFSFETSGLDTPNNLHAYA
jgi:hypothetical protein